MIVAFSTSSPLASLAVFDGEGSLLWEAHRAASGQASEAVLQMLEEAPVTPAAVTWWLSDLGPGSFTGTRVGVVLAKTLAWTFGRPCGGTSSFDLIAADAPVAIPNRKDEWLVREPGRPPRTSPAGDVAAVGYAPGLEPAVYPDAARFGPLLSRLERTAPEHLIPGYVVPPSISQPKRPQP